MARLGLPLDCQPQTLVCLGPIGFSWLPHIICSEETVFVWEFLKTQAPTHLQFDILFPWGL